MRILHVINCFARSGGAEKLVLDLARAQRRSGDDVTIVSLVSRDDPNDDFTDIANVSGIKVIDIHKGSLYSISLFMKLCKLLRNSDYDIVHAHLFPALYYCAILRSFIRNLFFTEHSTNNRRRNVLFKAIDRYIYKRYNCTVCISKEVQNKLGEHVGDVNTAVVPNGIPMHEFNCSEPYDVKELIGVESGKIMLMVARFIETKDHKTFFDALYNLHDDVHAVCIGAGPTEVRYKRYCEENGLSDRVHFLGIRNDVSRIMKTADVIVLSTAYEGFSISMLEAMASGRPFVASRVPGVVDLIEDYTELFSYGNSKELADIVSRLLTDKEYHDDIVTENLRFVIQYDIDEIAKRYSMVYEKNSR